MVDGVAQVVIYGQKQYAVRVQLNPDELATRGLGIDEVAEAVAAANSMLPTGSLEGSHRADSIKSSGQLMNARAFSDAVVAYRNGAPVRLRDLGEVVDSFKQDKQLTWSNGGAPSIMLAVERQPGTNTVQVVDSIRALLPALEKQLPPSAKVEVFYDRSESIRESVADVKFTLVLTVFLVVLVIFIFLRNLPATIIPSLALPMSVISTFAVMSVLGYSLDNLSLMALTLAVGFVVDDAIVMLENIVRHQEMGKDPQAAAFDGSSEIGFTIVSMDINAFLVDVLKVQPAEQAQENAVSVTYHDSCHLKKSLGVVSQPRSVVAANPAYKITEMAEADRCCGCGGSFNLFHYDYSRKIGQRKRNNVVASGAKIVAAGCPACMMQLEDVLSHNHDSVRVKHTVELYAESLK